MHALSFERGLEWLVGYRGKGLAVGIGSGMDTTGATAVSGLVIHLDGGTDDVGTKLAGILLDPIDDRFRSQVATRLLGFYPLMPPDFFFLQFEEFAQLHCLAAAT